MPGPIPQEATLESIAAKIQAGDLDAEEQFVAIFQARVRAFAMVNTGDPPLADELVQDVLWGVIRALREGKVERPQQLAAFVFGTARNLLNDGFRSRAREKLGPFPEWEIPSPAIGQQAFDRSHTARQAIATLEAHERVVLMLSLVEGLNPEQIASRLGINASAVRQRKGRALRKLSEILGSRSQVAVLRLL